MQKIMDMPIAQVLLLASKHQIAPEDAGVTARDRALLKDPLAQKVHAAPAKIRRLIGTVLTIRS